MQVSDISLLVLNSIKDAKTTIDNYDFFRETDPDGLYSELVAANEFTESCGYYYRDKSCLGNILNYVHSYYEPYVSAFEDEVTEDIKKAKRVSDILLPGTALSTVLTAFERGFFPVALTMGTISLVLYIAIKTRQWERKRQWRCFKKYDDEAKTITREQLGEALDSKRESVLEALSKNYKYKTED